MLSTFSSPSVFPHEKFEENPEKTFKPAMQYTWHNNKFYLHILLISQNDANLYYRQLQKVELQLHYELYEDEITIYPRDPDSSGDSCYGTDIQIHQHLQSKMPVIILNSEEEALIFRGIFIGIFSHHIMMDENIIYISSKYLTRRHSLITSTFALFAKLKPEQCDISHKYKCIDILHPKKSFLIDTIPDQKILPVDVIYDISPKILGVHSEMAAFEVYEKLKIKALVAIYANGFCSGGGGAGGVYDLIGQEEEMLMISDASRAMPIEIKPGLVSRFGGIYKIDNVKLVKNQQSAMMDYVFVAMPNLGDGIRGFDTPSEINYFSRASYLVHVTSLVILQFYLARYSNNILITGRHGCGFFNNKDRDVSAIIHAVGAMPEFKNIQIIFALGKDKLINSENQDCLVHDIYRKPSQKIIREVETAIKKIRKNVFPFTPLNISKNLMVSYEKAKKTCLEINGINICIDNFFIDPNRRPEHSKIKLWENNHPYYYIEELKNDIREGLHDEKPLTEILSAWEKRNHLRDKNVLDLRAEILNQFGSTSHESPRFMLTHNV